MVVLCCLCVCVVVQVVIAKQLKSSELVLRETALVAIAAGGVAGKAEIFKVRWRRLLRGLDHPSITGLHGA